MCLPCVWQTYTYVGVDVCVLGLGTGMDCDYLSAQRNVEETVSLQKALRELSNIK